MWHLVRTSYEILGVRSAKLGPIWSILYYVSQHGLYPSVAWLSWICLCDGRGRLGIHKCKCVNHPRNFVRFRVHKAVINIDPCNADLCFLMSNVSKEEFVWDSQRLLGRFSIGFRIRIDTTFHHVASILNQRWMQAVDPSVCPMILSCMQVFFYDAASSYLGERHHNFPPLGAML